MLKKTPASRDPLEALLSAPEGAVLAVIAGVEGPSYRPVGAMMAVMSADQRAGTLSSGCIEADIALHALQTAEAGASPHAALRAAKRSARERGVPFRDWAGWVLSGR
ncbi:MAG: XdhC family protein [Pseudomonadota bacterium]